MTDASNAAPDSASVSAIVDYLEALVAFDTQNPPRDLSADSAIFGYLADQLTDFDTTVTDHGDGHVSFFAVRGKPSVLFNVHLDTVPVGNGWRQDPLKLAVHDGRAWGRGACDIKGAAAALLDLARTTSLDLALLLTTDEEGAGGCCVRRFCEAGGAESFDLVVVAEPTSCRAVSAHRGYLSVTGRFSGTAGHSSEARGLDDNALHRFSAWAGEVLQTVRAEFPDSRFNLGRVDGGIKSNVIADRVDVAWSARLPPGTDSQEFLGRVSGLGSGAAADWTVPFLGPPLPASQAAQSAAEQQIGALGLERGPAVDFWTEASLFSAAGRPAFVMGPGDIAQAHAVDEWVSLEQLVLARRRYEQVVTQHG